MLKVSGRIRISKILMFSININCCEFMSRIGLIAGRNRCLIVRGWKGQVFFVSCNSCSKSLMSIRIIIETLINWPLNALKLSNFGKLFHAWPNSAGTRVILAPEWMRSFGVTQALAQGTTRCQKTFLPHPTTWRRVSLFAEGEIIMLLRNLSS